MGDKFAISCTVNKTCLIILDLDTTTMKDSHAALHFPRGDGSYIIIFAFEFWVPGGCSRMTHSPEATAQKRRSNNRCVADVACASVQPSYAISGPLFRLLCFSENDALGFFSTKKVNDRRRSKYSTFVPQRTFQEVSEQRAVSTKGRVISCKFNRDAIFAYAREALEFMHVIYFIQSHKRQALLYYVIR